MLSYFDLLLDLLNISQRELYAPAAEALEQSPEKKLICFHPYGFLFSAFADLLRQKISLEDYLQTGDVSSVVPLDAAVSDGAAVLQGMEYAFAHGTWAAYRDIIFVIDRASAARNGLDVFSLQKKLADVGSKIFVI
jgi:hypothetical protein